MNSPFNKKFMAKSPLQAEPVKLTDAEKSEQERIRKLPSAKEKPKEKKPKPSMGNFEKGLKTASDLKDPKSYLKNVVSKYAESPGQKAALNNAIKSYG
jgi:hypothetical protein